MVSWWWLLVAFWAGTCVGLLLAALMAMSRDSDEKLEQAERELRRRRFLHWPR